jgi:hypothetical protein
MSRVRASLMTPVLAGLVWMWSPHTEAAPPGSPNVRVLSVTKTLPADGTDVPVTFSANGDALIFEILVDNYPTLEEDLCEVQDLDPPITCTESDHRLVSFTIDEKDFRAGQLPEGIANNDRIEIRPLLGQIFGSDVELPLAGRSELVLTFDTDNGSNDVAIEVTVGFIGGQGASLE